MKLLSLLVALALLGTGPSRAEEPQTPDDVMAFAIKKMADYKTWSAHFSHLINSRGVPLSSEGSLLCKPPQLRAQIASETTGGPLKTLMALGKDHLLWLQTESPEGGKIFRGDLQKLSSDDVDNLVPQSIFLELMEPAKLWETSKKDFNFTLGTNEVLEGLPVYAVQGTLKPQTASDLLRPELTNEIVAVSGLCRILIGTQDGFLYLIERSVRYTPRETRPYPIAEGEGLVLKKVIFNEETPDEKFVFEPRKGVPITELKPKPPDDVLVIPANKSPKK